MKNDYINNYDSNFIKFINNCKLLNINIKKDNKMLKKEEILEKIDNYRIFLKRKTLKMLDEYYKEVNKENFIVKLEKIYKTIKKFENKLNLIKKYLNNDYFDEDISSIFLDSDINLLNLEIKIEDIKSNDKFLDEYKNS